MILGASAYRMTAGDRDRCWLGPFVAASLSALPDADVVLPFRYHEPWGHRGMTHSFAFAAVVGVVAALIFRRRLTFPGGVRGLAALFAVVTASHGVLDALTSGGLGIALLAPFDHARYFFPWRPVPVAPIGYAHWVWRVMAWEALLFWPLGLTFATARTRLGTARRLGVVVAMVTSVAAWAYRSGATP